MCYDKVVSCQQQTCCLAPKYNYLKPIHCQLQRSDIIPFQRIKEAFFKLYSNY